ncbi:DedA family protein [Rheinheimera sp. 4Y26]|uniref:DedA family protein n=1 Tax=Rheinheimera sp. 4Y26 TaxID=2977811 RepID=UPI0021B09560|nr:DedA family protein [Rheinheimera sp. 4Y26]MCT6698054.1 DedA family protein [Rheinheimera sp. 4Y26]
MYDALIAIWQQDYQLLVSHGAIAMVVFCLVLILFLESAFVFLPLPGDSLVLLSGGLVASGVIGYEVTLLYLPLAAGLGSLVAYWQGYALAHTRFMHHIERMVPQGSLPRAHDLLEKHGFMAMFSSRFVPFVRVLTPMLMGMTGMKLPKVALVSFISAFCWTFALSLFSSSLMKMPQLEQYHHLLTKGLIMISAVLFVLAILAIVYRWYRYPQVNKAE